MIKFYSDFIKLDCEDSDNVERNISISDSDILSDEKLLLEKVKNFAFDEIHSRMKDSFFEEKGLLIKPYTYESMNKISEQISNFTSFFASRILNKLYETHKRFCGFYLVSSHSIYERKNKKEWKMIFCFYFTVFSKGVKKVEDFSLCSELNIEKFNGDRNYWGDIEITFNKKFHTSLNGKIVNIYAKKITNDGRRFYYSEIIK